MAHGRAVAAVLATIAMVAVALPAQAAEPAAAASTSLHLTSITHVATKTNPGTTTVVSGDKAVLHGTASANLIGRTLSVEVKHGSDWDAYPGSGTVSSSKTFAIRIRVTGNGRTTYRVVYAGSSKLKSATGSKSVLVWSWLRLVQLPIASTDGSSVAEASAHPQTNVKVAGINRASVLAGTVPAGGTGVATFHIAKHCSAFKTSVGMSDGSPATGSVEFSVYFGDVAITAKKPKHGKTTSIALSTKKVSDLVLRNTEQSPENEFADPVIAAWPDAQVLCNVAF